MNRKEAILFAHDHDLTLSAKDFKYTVFLEHEDGSKFQWVGAFCMKHDEEWMIVFTEHHKYHVYYFSEVIVRQYKRIREEIPEIKKFPSFVK